MTVPSTQDQGGCDEYDAGCHSHGTDVRERSHYDWNMECEDTGASYEAGETKARDDLLPVELTSASPLREAI